MTKYTVAVNDAEYMSGVFDTEAEAEEHLLALVAEEYPDFADNIETAEDVEDEGLPMWVVEIVIPD